jgi:RHS repeat-associated protein
MKPNLLMRLLIAAFFFACVSSSAKAQTTPDVLEGSTPYQSFHGGDFDSINLSNGNVLLRIPLVDYPQRGGALKLGFTFVENSKVAAAGEKCFPQSGCEDIWYSYTATVSSVPVVFNQVVDDQAARVVQSTYYLPHNPSEFAAYAAVTSDGAMHPLVIAGTESADATAFYANPTGTNQLTPPTLAINREGIRFNLTELNGTLTREDPNGNQILAPYIGSTGNYTDTIGRSIPNPPGAATTDFTGCPSGGTLLPVASATLWTVPGPNGGTVNFKFCDVTVNVSIPANEPSPVKGTSGPLTLTQSIVLPNGTAWSFEYNDRNPGDPSSVNYGIPTEITLPTGGTITYAFTTFASGNASQSWSRWVTSRTVNANDGTGPHTWNYVYAGVGSSTPTTTVTDPLGNNTVHTFGLFGTAGIFETETQYYQLINGVQTPLKTVNTNYTFLNGGNYSYPIASVIPKSTTTTWPNNQVSQIQTDYDSQSTGSENWSYGNVIAKREYDYGNNAPGPLLRTTTTQYEAFVNSNYLTNNLMSLLSSVQITDGGGTQRANTTYSYDEYALQPSGLGASQQLDLTPPDGVYRGNRTSVHRWLSGSATATTNCNISVTNGYLVSYSTYNDSGTVYSSTDSCGSAAGDSKHTTNYLYSNSSPYEGAYPTTIKNPLGQSTIMTYDSNIGRLASTEDPNLQIASFTYDNMWRIATVSYPDGGSATITHQETTFPFTATLTKKITSSLNYSMTNTFDGMGRASELLVTDLQGNIETDTTYDANGRKYTVSNPYRTTSDSTYGITSYVYDALGRTCVVVPPDGTAVANTSCPATQPSNDVFTVYSGSSTTVTDQQGKSRKSQTDGLGRLTNVWEDPSSLNYETIYTYDALDDLATILQGGSHSRSFAFDSLKRLTSSANPEAGTVTYTYDADSNVITKKDARTFTITYGYDVLNRMIGKTYSNGDPAVSYSYDQTGCLGLSACYNIGRRTAMTDAGGSETWAYDQMGRELAEQRITNSITKNTSYTYNVDGSLATLIYPSGRTITYTTDSTERPSEAQDVANGINYAMGSCANGANSNGSCYAPHGALLQAQNGANLISTLYYDKRLQPCRISVKSSGTAPTSCSDTTKIGNVIDYTYSFGLGTADNGNVMGITNNVDNTRSQSFTYDHLNRIVTAETASTHATSPANCWGESYTYDQWANLTAIGVASSSYNGCTQESLSVTALSNNQLSATGFSYDASGNILTDGHNTYGWNAESEIKTAGGVNYTYDGDGDRIEKSNGKIYWYGAGSEILDESDLSGNITDEYIFFGGKRIARRDSSGNIVYYAADHLGTSRVVTNATGGILDQSDFYPFGGERILSSSSGNTYKFEGKERDTETNNDDFGARYYSSQFGRWLSPDWSAVPVPVPYANLSNPQTLNLYAMVSDNPETFADLDGHDHESAPQPDGSSISLDYAPDAGQQQAAEQQAAKNNPANSSQGTTAQPQEQKPNIPAPTNPDGSEKSPTNDVPKPPDGKAPGWKPGDKLTPNDWKPGEGTDKRPTRWEPKYRIPGQSQPNVSWDDKQGHWDHNDGHGNRTHWLPNGGGRVDHYNKPILQRLRELDNSFNNFIQRYWPGVMPL